MFLEGKMVCDKEVFEFIMSITTGNYIIDHLL